MNRRQPQLPAELQNRELKREIFRLQTKLAKAEVKILSLKSELAAIRKNPRDGGAAQIQLESIMQRARELAAEKYKQKESRDDDA